MTRVHSSWQLSGPHCFVAENYKSSSRVKGVDDSKEDVIVLRHVILSHHGLLEYGSRIRQGLWRAEILLMIDNPRLK